MNRMSRRLVLAAAAVALLGAALALFLWLRRGDHRPTSHGDPPVEATWDIFTGELPAARSGDIELDFGPLPELRVGRAYDQRSQIPLTNSGSGPARVRVHARAPAALAAGFVGRGSMDWHAEQLVELAPGETWMFPLIVHTPSTPAGSHPVTLHALVLERGEWRSAAQATAHVVVELEPLAITASCVPAPAPEDRARVIQELTIENSGAEVGDLTVTLADGHQDAARFSPLVDGHRLAERDTLKVRVLPRLHAGYRGGALPLVITGNGQRQTVTCHPTLRPGERVFVVGARCTTAERAAGTRCTNRRHTAYDLPPPRGTHGGPRRPAPPDPGRAPSTTPPGPGPGPGQPAPVRDAGLDPDADAGGFEEEYRSGFSFEDSEEAEREVEENLRNATEDVRDTVGSEAFGADEATGDPRDVPGAPIDRPLGLPAYDPGRARLADPVANTLERVVRRDGARMDALIVHRTATAATVRYRPMSDALRARIPARTLAADGAFSAPRLAALPDGSPIAAYVAAEADRTVIEVVAIDSGERVRLGQPERSTSQPVLLPRGDGVDVLYLEAGAVWRARLDRELTPSAPTAVLRGVDHTSFLRAARRADGSVAVLTRRNPLLLHDTSTGRTTELPGVIGDLRFDPQGRLVVVLQRRDGSVEARVDGSSTPLVAAGWSTSPPVLVRTETGLRMYLHRHFAGAPRDQAGGTYIASYAGGTWDRALTRVAHPEAPVEAAYLALDFSLPWHSASYKPMNTEVRLNGERVGRLRGRVPNGRFLFRVPVELLHLRSLSSATPRSNRVELETTSIGGGNFHLVDRAALYVRHSYIQDMVVATTREQAERLAGLSTLEIRHRTPDLVLDSNHWEPPRAARPGQTLTALIGVTNTGDAPLPPGELIARAGDQVLGQASYPAVAGFARARVRVPVQLPAQWNPDDTLRFTISADFSLDPTGRDNTLEFGIFGTPPPALAGPRAPARATAQPPSPRDVILEPGQPVAVTDLHTYYRFAVPPAGDLVVEVMTPSGARIPVTPVLYRLDGTPLADADNHLTATDRELRMRLAGDRALPAGATIMIQWQPGR